MENIAWFTMKIPNLQIRIDEQRRIVAYLDGLQAKVNVLRELQSPPFHLGDGSQSASGEELRLLFGRTLMPSILDKAFKGQL